jgi:formylglycine-generating enzyme required for sulfatase activity
VTIAKAFYIGKYVVTQKQYEAIMGENPSCLKGKRRPVEQVSWHDAQTFCKKASAMTGRVVRRPTEAEWEYACRAGTKTEFSFGDNQAGMDDYAWSFWNSDKQAFVAPCARRTMLGRAPRDVRPLTRR